MKREEFEAAVKAVWPDAEVCLMDFEPDWLEVSIESDGFELAIQINGREQPALAAALAALKGANDG